MIIMYCRICGSSKNTSYNSSLRYVVCPQCAEGTPEKVSFEDFCERYFAGDLLADESTKRSFYEDYLYSKDTLDEYIESTTIED